MSRGMDFGGWLRDARERRGLSLRQISAATRISIHSLEALEQNDVARLPGGIFARAFVRAYAVQVGLDPEEAVKEFLQQFPDESVTFGSPLVRERQPADVFESAGDQPDWRRVALLGAAVLAFGIGAIYGVRWLRGDVSASAPSEATPPAASANRSAPANTPGPGPIAGAPAQGASPPPAAAPVPTSPLLIELVPTGLCWARITADGATVFEGLLEQGKTQQAEAQQSIVLRVGDAGACQYRLNGRPGRPLGEPGDVLTVRFTPGTVAQFTAAPAG